MPKFARTEQGQEMRLTEDEIALIKASFGGNERLLKVLRKIFLPEYDPTAPFGQTIDLWLAMTDIKSLPPDVAYQHILARNMVIGHVEAQIQQLKFFSDQKVETPEEKALREKKDSSK